MNNYDYCIEIVKARHPASARVLDYGCGAGHIVQSMRDQGFDAYGCDVFYEGVTGYIDKVPAALKGKYVLQMSADKIPFADHSFDFIICNQVLEHVPDMNRVLAEMKRVLRPGGELLSLFPDSGVWREGHCGIAFLHWFAKGTNGPRVWWASLWRALGFGYQKEGKPVVAWARHWCQWLDDWTHYRSEPEIQRQFAAHFSDWQSLEVDWLERRYSHRAALFGWWPHWLKRLFVVKFGGLIFLTKA